MSVTGDVIKVITQIILITLALITLRDVIAKIFGIPRNSKIGKWFYTQYDKETLLEIFNVVGIDNESFRNNVRNAQNDHKKIERPEERLVYFLSKYTYDFLTEYGKDTPTKTNFYMNTMEAAHFPNDLDQMTTLIANLIHLKKGDIHQDFIVTPKCGNPMLGQNYTTIYNNIFLLSKYESDKSRSKFNIHQDPLISLMINFEGFAALKKEAEDNPDKDFCGYVIDCNLSGGSLILKPMTEFNRMIELLHNKNTLTNIKPLQKAFILFRADTDITDQGNFDEVFKENGLECFRYFDLDEKNKSLLFNYKKHNNTPICNCLTNDRTNFENEFINKLRCRNLTKYN